MDDLARQKLLEDLQGKLSRNVCVLCAKEFETKEALEIHFWDHTDDRFELECLICGQTFFVREHLTNHVNSHIDSIHPRTPPSPTCPVFKLSKYFLFFYYLFLFTYLVTL